MKTIKFREYDSYGLINGRSGMKYSNRLDGQTVTKFTFAPYHESQGWVGSENDHELMQYTGVNDQDGQEIYEGDVVDLINKTGEKERAIVKFEHGCFTPVFMFPSARIKVVGNVFQ